MGFFHSFERKVEDGVEGAASMFEGSAITPVQITKKAEKQMKREKMAGSGRQIAPTLYTCIVSEADDAKLFGYYATLAGEVETYLQAKADDLGYSLDCKPLVRFVVDPDLKRGKFDVIAELVSPPTIQKLRAEEYDKYGIPTPGGMSKGSAQAPGRSNMRPNMPPNIPNNIPNNMPSNMQQAPGRPRPSVMPPSQGGQGGQPSMQNNPRPNPNMQPVPVSSSPIIPQAQAAPANPAAAAAPAAAAPIAAVPAAPADADAEKTQIVGETVPAAASMPAANVGEVYFYDEVNDIAYRLTGQVESIGRESANDIVVSDINASRRHANVYMDQTGAWIVEDAGSTNGLYVNGRRVSSAQLVDADIVLIGTTRLEFQNLS